MLPTFKCSRCVQLDDRYWDSELNNTQAFTPVAILLISWTFRIQEPNKKLAVIVLMISTGVALASHGELHFNLVGFITQAAAVAVSDSRPHIVAKLLKFLYSSKLLGS